MYATNWWQPQTKDALNRRAGGRRRINAERKARAQKRRDEIKEILGDGGMLLCGRTGGRGKESKLAAYFGVHRATICRDIAALKAEWRRAHICSFCGSVESVPLKALTRLAKRGLWDGCTAQRCKEEVLIDRLIEAHLAANGRGGRAVDSGT